MWQQRMALCNCWSTFLKQSVHLQFMWSQNKIRNVTVICISEGLSCGELPSITLSYCYPVKFLYYKRSLHTGRLQYITKARNSKYLKIKKLCKPWKVKCAQWPKELGLSIWSLPPAINWCRHLHKTTCTSNMQQKKENLMIIGIDYCYM